jgi:NDP-sugar pyrophosphorylase family protein
MAVKADTEERFVACYADNLTDFEVGKLVSFYCGFMWSRGVST